MINYLKNIATQINEIQGVEAKLLPDGTLAFGFCHLKSPKGNILIEKEFNEISIEECITHCSVEIPIVLVFTGKGIIFKKILKSAHETITDAVGAIISNADSNDFAFDVFETEYAFFIAIIRKQRLQDILNTFLNKNLPIIQVRLESIPLLETIETLRLPISEFTINNQNLLFDKNVFIDQKPTENDNTTLVIGEQKITPNKTIPYVSALNVFITQGNLKTSNFLEILQTNDAFFQMKLFKKGLVLGLCTLLAILLINTLLFTSQFSKNEELKQHTSALQSQNTNLKSDELDILEKEKYLSQNGWLHKSKLSFMADRIAASVPSSIHLIDLNINPIKIEYSGFKKSTFEPYKITLKGKCNKSTELSNWIQILKNLNWITDVQMKDYNFDHSTNNAVFNIEISYKID